VLRGHAPQAEAAALRGILPDFVSSFGKLKRDETSSLHPSEPRTRLGHEALDQSAQLIKLCKRHFTA